MKRVIVLVGFVATNAFAQNMPPQDVAYVVGVQPRMVTIQQQQCRQVTEQREDHSTAGAIMGGIAGGILGNQVGKGSGKTVATAGGAVAGALAGNYLGQGGPAQTRTVCDMVPMQVQQGRIVTFNYQGRIFSQQFDQ